MRSRSMSAPVKNKRILPLALAALALTAAAAFAKPNTDVTVDTTNNGLMFLNEKPAPKEENLTFYRDENSRIGLTDDGEPAWTNHF